MVHHRLGTAYGGELPNAHACSFVPAVIVAVRLVVGLMLLLHDWAFCQTPQ